MTKKEIDDFKHDIEKESTISLLYEYAALYHYYIEYTDSEDETKMEIVINEILKRTGELKNETINKCKGNL